MSYGCRKTVPHTCIISKTEQNSTFSFKMVFAHPPCVHSDSEELGSNTFSLRIGSPGPHALSAQVSPLGTVHSHAAEQTPSAAARKAKHLNTAHIFTPRCDCTGDGQIKEVYRTLHGPQSERKDHSALRLDPAVRVRKKNGRLGCKERLRQKTRK